ncbi:hypothetical protein HK100_003709 [Physocladia obscura]|uniref:BZIP domain-containing protein n=1 Tax=Physocladia obscura TaxID=109957 RepID=A0AAD5SUM3_9FUNG|nr:hypothetical protein HK100_003709 [Physocladia obscura]
MADTSTNKGMYNPHSNRGRRKQISEATTTRQQQLRNAQRALRARKQDYILDLEERIDDLIRENKALKKQVERLSARETPCLNENCTSQIQALQQKLSEMELLARSAVLNPPISMTVPIISERMVSLLTPPPVGLLNLNCDFVADESIVSIIDANFSKWLSAEECYGPIDVEPFKAKMKLIESLKEAGIVDRLFALFVVN